MAKEKNLEEKVANLEQAVIQLSQIVERIAKQFDLVQMVLKAHDTKLSN